MTYKQTKPKIRTGTFYRVMYKKDKKLVPVVMSDGNDLAYDTEAEANKQKEFMEEIGIATGMKTFEVKKVKMQYVNHEDLVKKK